MITNSTQKKILLLCPYPVGQSPSQRFRFEQYLSALVEQGFEVVVRSFFSLSAWAILYKPGHYAGKVIGTTAGFLRRFFILLTVPRYDLIFIHREATPVGPPVIEFIIARIFRKKIVYDFDDSIWIPNTSAGNTIVSRLKWHSKVPAICRWSYRVSCGNDYLCDYARRFNSSVVRIPTTIDTENLHNPSLFPIKTPGEKITIGWTGTHSTLKYLSNIVPVIQTLEQKFPGQIRFLVIADIDPQLPIGSFAFKPWTTETEIEDLLQIDIGIMPLTDDPWSNGKCGFKALQYLALEIPAVVSPVGVNKQIIQHGENGFLAETKNDWLTTLSDLIVNPEMRKKTAIAGRTEVIRHYSVLSNTSSFLALLE